MFIALNAFSLANSNNYRVFVYSKEREEVHEIESVFCGCYSCKCSISLIQKAQLLI